MAHPPEAGQPGAGVPIYQVVQERKRDVRRIEGRVRRGGSEGRVGKPARAGRGRAPARDVTTRMLLLHTAGFGYDFFDERYNRLATEHGQPSVVTASRASINTPLLFDPVDEWECGSSIPSF
jgi:hypothetical protein